MQYANNNDGNGAFGTEQHLIYPASVIAPDALADYQEEGHMLWADKIRKKGWRHVCSDMGAGMYERISRTGTYYTLRITDYHGVTIERAPSIEYYERYLLGENKGTHIREYVRI